MKKNIIIKIFVFLLCIIYFFALPSCNEKNSNNHIIENDEVALHFYYDSYDDFIKDYYLLKNKFNFEILMPNKTLSDKLGFKYEINGVGVLKDDNQVLDIDRGISSIRISYKYSYVDYINNYADYSILLNLKYTSSIKISNFNNEFLKVEYDNNELSLNYNDSFVAKGNLSFGNALEEKYISNFINEFKDSLIYC